jgi:hypothetical protein
VFCLDRVSIDGRSLLKLSQVSDALHPRIGRLSEMASPHEAVGVTDIGNQDTKGDGHSLPANI